MVWGFFLLLGIIVAVHWFEYQRSIQEYIFTQPPNLESSVLKEKSPTVVEIGVLPWRPGPSSSTIVTDDGTSIASAEWWSMSDKPVISNGTELAAELELATGLADINDARAWWWLPGLFDVSVDYLAKERVQGLQWVTAERHWIGCSAGNPVTVWLVHSRYRRYLPVEAGAQVDPWAITVATNPWIGRVQYIEVRVKPGWCLGVPSHWGFAVRSESTEPAKEEKALPEKATKTMKAMEAMEAMEAIHESAIWNASQHSALSWCLSNTEYIPLHIELLNQHLEE